MINNFVFSKANKFKAIIRIIVILIKIFRNTIFTGSFEYICTCIAIGFYL